jgi:hypothetical protein
LLAGDVARGLHCVDQDHGYDQPDQHRKDGDSAMMTDPHERIRPGMDVVDLAGDRVGRVTGTSGRLPDLSQTGDLDPVARNQEAKRAGLGAAGHVKVEYRGHTIHVPLTEINDVRDDAVVLAVDREAIDAQGWQLAPTSQTSQTS